MFAALRQQQCDHLDANDMLLQEPFQEPQSHECSMKSSSMNQPFLWNSVPLCPRMYWLNSGVYELRTILPTTYRSPTVSCNIQLVIPSSVHSLNRRIEISSSLEWSCAAVGKLAAVPRHETPNWIQVDHRGSTLKVENTLKHAENPSQCGFG